MLLTKLIGEFLSVIHACSLSEGANGAHNASLVELLKFIVLVLGFCKFQCTADKSIPNS